MTEKVLIDLSHRQFVVTVPKALLPFFRHDRSLFADVSRLINNLIGEFYNEAAGRCLLSGMVIAHQTFGDMLRWNPHFHAIVLEGGYDDEGTFFYILFTGISDGDERFSFPEDEVEVEVLAYKQAWARLLAKVYEIDPLICPKCGGEMKVIAVIGNPDEIKRILRHLVKIGRPPPGLDPARLN